MIQVTPQMRILVAIEPAQVELHLAFVLGLEGADFQVDGDEPAELAVVEDEVDVEVFAVDLQALLARHEAEAAAELEDERLQGS